MAPLLIPRSSSSGGGNPSTSTIIGTLFAIIGILLVLAVLLRAGHRRLTTQPSRPHLSHRSPPGVPLDFLPPHARGQHHRNWAQEHAAAAAAGAQQPRQQYQQKKLPPLPSPSIAAVDLTIEPQRLEHVSLPLPSRMETPLLPPRMDEVERMQMQMQLAPLQMQTPHPPRTRRLRGFPDAREPRMLVGLAEGDRVAHRGRTLERLEGRV